MKIFSLLFLVLCCTSVFAYSLRDEEAGLSWFFDASNTNFVALNLDLNYYNKAQGDLIVPSKLPHVSGGEPNGRYWTVQNLKSECCANETGVTSVVVQEGISKIGDRAFFGCTNMKSAVLPTSLEDLGSRVFGGCSALTTVNIPSGISILKGRLFEGCSSLVMDTIPDNITIVEDSVFAGCLSLVSINLPDTVTIIGKSVFENCTSLTSVELSKNLTIIPDTCFKGCSSLQTIELPDNIVTIGEEAFYGCKNLTELQLPEGVQVVGDKAFNETGIEVLTFPESVLSCYELPEMTTVYMRGNVPANFSAKNVDCVYYTKQYASQWDYFFRSNPTMAPAEWHCMEDYVNVIVSPTTAWSAPFSRKAIQWGEEVSITAEVVDGYLFLGWGSNQPGIGGTDTTLTFVMPETEVTLVATFLPKALIEELIDEKIDGRIDGESLLTKEQAEAKTEATIEEKKEAGELFDQAGVDAKVEATITEKVDNKELVTRESIQEMALGTPIIEVENAQAKVGISLKRASTLDGEWEEVTLDVGAAEVDNGTVKVSVPAEDNAAFYKFVVPDGLQTPAQEETP